MAKQRFLNNFTSIFVAAVKDAPSSGTPETELDYGVLRISDGAAGSLINPTDGDYYLLTAFKRSGSIESNIEVMRVTGVSNATPGECRITVQRAQEGTSAKAFVAGDYLSLRITKGTAENFSQPADLATKEPVIAAPSSTPTEKYWRGDKTWRDFFTDVRAATLTGLSTATNAVVAATDTVLAAIGKLQAQVSSKFDKTGGNVDGNINITGTGRRIQGDFSDATVANRLMFQTSAANSPTTLGVLPSGTSEAAALAAYANSDPSNTSSMRMLATSIDGRLDANRSGTGNYLPMTFYTGGVERMRINPYGGLVATGRISCSYVNSSIADAGIDLIDSAATGGNSIRWVDSNGYVANISQYSSAHATLAGVMTINNAGGYRWSIYEIERLRIDSIGNVLATSGALGYGVGAGGTALQTTSRTAGVVLNKPTGVITLVSAAGSTTWSSFTVTNSFVSVGDTVLLSIRSGVLNAYTFVIGGVANGSFQINFIANGTVVDQPSINFSVLKAATS